MGSNYSSIIPTVAAIVAANFIWTKYVAPKVDPVLATPTYDGGEGLVHN